MKEAVIVAGARTPVGKAKKGAFKSMRSDELAGIAIQETLKRSGYTGAVDDVILGCALPEAEQGMNIARYASVLGGLSHEVPAITINRYCSSGLQSIADAAMKIMTGQATAVVAGGLESMSQVPMPGHVVRPNPSIVDTAPEYYMSMGHTAEQVAATYNVSREDQDAFALKSHQKAAAAIAAGKFVDEIVPITVTEQFVNDELKIEEKTFVVEHDEGVRPDSSPEGLAKLRPAFRLGGSVTAGNSSQTSDGAAAVLVMEREEAERQGLPILGKFKSFAVGGVRPEVMGIGPVVAIPKALDLAGITLEDVGLIELNEAFASQSLGVIRELGLNEDIVNVNGGAIALGHPLGCTGTKLTLTLLHEMKRRNVQYGVVSMCIGGGMGAAGVFELVEGGTGQ
ncbi:acetyl-CoA acetyltransferase [Exiguobacterium sp. U13-1]|uniref:acetyl-CoA C-acyltransferase n=1 Tax=Exiguobacterium acetylicum TaxID=41170 RepID=A0ABX8G882_EXIAC|nr:MULTISPECIES: acetyl-CoA C-acetyltransferase [Exiguobacterium]AOT01522.1 acetyl-CoA acetyltransferase [Exiguobacterium sp. U13-1]QWB29478.1 acetyl-CoA C-acetyltransferase [Exiguobacterium acetylicum]